MAGRARSNRVMTAGAMSLLRFHCPGCQAVCQLPDTIVATSARTRCATCGLMFAVARPEGNASPAEIPVEEKSIPEPPSVIYHPVVPPALTPSQVYSDALAEEYPPMPANSATEAAPGPIPSQPFPRPAPSQPAAKPASARSENEGSLGVRNASPLGPPPPYRPIAAAPRPTPPQPRMVTLPPAEPVNIRGISALGPPPPYRPIVQASPEFGRGPAPDLEPWRLASMTRIPLAGRAEPESNRSATPLEDDDWALMRESEPPIQPVATPIDTTRFEVETNVASGNLPLLWPAEGDEPAAVKPGITPRASKRRRRLIWTCGIVAAVLASVAVLHVERQRVVRAFPPAGQFYNVAGLLHELASGVPAGQTGSSAIDCTDRRQADEAASLDGKPCHAGPDTVPK